MTESEREHLASSLSNESAATSGDDGHALDELIRLRAYQLYQERGAQDGDDTGDWLRAESECIERIHLAAELGTGEQRASGSAPGQA